MRKILLSLTLLVGFASQAIADYAATQGAGTDFGSNVVSAVHYPQQNMCDPTTPARCVVVDASGRITVLQGTTPWSVAGPAASGAALSGNPVRIGMSDGTNAQNWLAAIALGDGVNGNNTGAVATWLWNGTTWDRARGDATNGAWVNVKNTLTAVTPGDGITTTIYGTAPASPVIGVPLLWNGTTYDRQKSAGATGIAAVATIDPCQSATVNSTPINISTATTTRIATESASVKIYICHLSIVTAAANNVALIEGTGASCAGGTPAGMAGGTSAASGWNFSANGGISLGMGGYSINQTANQAYSVCLVTSAATQLSGVMKWVAR